MSNLNVTRISTKSLNVATLLVIFGGWAGLHQFYLGNWGRGVLSLVTFGGFGVLWFWDFIIVASGKGYDSEGYRVMNKAQMRIYNEVNTIYTKK